LGELLGWRRTYDSDDEVGLEPPEGSREDGSCPICSSCVSQSESLSRTGSTDLRPDDQAAEVERIIGLGAKRIDSGQAGRDVIDELPRYRCAGLVVVGPQLHARDLEPLAREVAIVEVGRDVTGGLLDVIRNDDAVGTRQAVDHLVQLGHRAIAYLDGGDNPGAQSRRDGYRAAMANHGLDDQIRVVPGGYDENDGAAAAALLLDHGLPTAIIAANDPCAIGALDTLVRHGIAVPSDISLIGYDDATFGRIPGIDLTSVRQDIPRMAKLAMTALVDRLDRPDRKPVNRTLRPKLIVRGSTTGPRKRSVE
jgi:DNA-binding LacI/PurR family transcriptional regulator